jgi:hypothetical protein
MRDSAVSEICWCYIIKWLQGVGNKEVTSVRLDRSAIGAVWTTSTLSSIIRIILKLSYLHLGIFDAWTSSRFDLFDTSSSLARSAISLAP